METWNLYASLLLLVCLSLVQELYGYEHLITSVKLQFPFSGWMSNDAKLCKLKVACLSLRWEIHHSDLWLVCDHIKIIVFRMLALPPL